MPHLPSREKALLAAIFFVAACLRFLRLDDIPPGFQFDQAYYVFDAIFLLRGDFFIFFRDPGRSEPLFQYLLIPFVALFGGDTPLGPKVIAGIVGTLTIFLVYGITRALFESPFSSRVEEPRSSAEGNRNRGIGLLAAFLAAISFWHIFYCRYGERIPLTLFFATLAFWFFWRALTPHTSRLTPHAWDNYIYTGIFTGLTLYTYPSGRVVPIALILLTAYAALTDRARALDYAKGLVLAGILAVIVFLPLGTYYLQHPIDFISHTAEVSIFTPHGEISDNLALELGKNALKILGMFFVVGDSGVLRNLPYRPVFDPFVGALFVVGVMVWLAELLSPKTARLNRLRAVFLTVWLGLALGLSLVSDDAPNNGRILIGLPVVMILPAWGALTIWDWLRAPTARRAAAVALSGILLLSTLLVLRDTFIVWLNAPGTYYAFDADKVELSKWINQNAPAQHLYLAPVVYQVGTVSLLTRNAPLKSFDSRDTIVLPSRAEGKDALYIFPPEQERRLQRWAERLGALGAREHIPGANGTTLLLGYRVPALNLPDPQSPIPSLLPGGDFVRPQKRTRAVWNDSFALIGYSVDTADAAKRNLEVTLFLHALKAMSENYTFSVKARDAKDRIWGQDDKWAGSNSYATFLWSVGDVVIEKFYPGLNACAPAGAYRVTVEAYDPKTLQTLALTDRDGNLVELGVTSAEISPGNLYEHLEPDQTLNAKIGERLQLMGYTLTPAEARPGDELALSLFWRGVGAGGMESLSVRMQSAGQDTALLDAPIKIPAEGRGICAFYDLRVPANLPAGAATIWVNGFKIGEMKLR
jgi:hypothetical protein